MENSTHVLEEAVQEQQQVDGYLRDAANWFHENEGSMFDRGEAIRQLSDELAVDPSFADTIIANIVADAVDPIIQIKKSDGTYVGIVEFTTFDGAYGYRDFHDLIGERKRVICQRCVDQAEFDTEVAHATEKDPEGSFADGATYEELYDGIRSHYAEEHTVEPEEIETGATLASGTTIGGDTAWHDGNATLANLSIDSDRDWGNYDISNVRKFTAEDGNIVGKTLESGDSMTIDSDESMVVSESYDVQGTLTINGSLSVV